MNLHTLPRTFFLTRHGQSEYNLLGKIGGDSGLTPAGLEYARRLADFAKEYIAMEPDAAATLEQADGEDNGNRRPRPCRLWTSTLRRTKETAQFIDHEAQKFTFDNGETGVWVQFRQRERRNLDELYAGVCGTCHGGTVAGMAYMVVIADEIHSFLFRRYDLQGN